MVPVDDEPFRLFSAPTPLGLPGKDELNLAEFPIASVTDRVPAGQKTLRFEDRIYDEREGQPITRRLVITASDEYGLPTAKDDEIILGLVQLTRQANNFTERTVRFGRSDLIGLLAWPDTGPSYRRLALSFHRWLGVSLHYDNAWWDKAQQAWSTLGFHILESFKLGDGGRACGRREQPPSRFTWNEDVFRSFQAGYLKQLDLAFYLGLVHPTAKRMYRFLDKRFYHRDRWEFDLEEFVLDHIGLSRTYEGNAQLARKLRPAIRELEEKGFLEPLGPDERFQKPSLRRWRIVFVRQARVAEAKPTAPTSPASAMVAELTARGVTASTAEELVAAFPEVRVRAKLETLDWLLDRKDGRAMHSPAGFLVQSIREDYAPPEGFESQVDRARRLAAERDRARRAEEARRLRAAEERGHEQAKQAQIWSYWESLSPDAQDRLWEEALAGALPFLAGRYRRHRGRDGGLERRYRKLILEAHILDLLERRAGRGGETAGG